MMYTILGNIDNMFVTLSTTMGNLLINIYRSAGSAIDRTLAWGIDSVFGFLQILADTDFFGATAMKAFATRVYVLIALFMLFKLSFSLIKYLLDPEQFSSKDAGFSKMVQKAMIALVLLVLVPFVFDVAFRMQAIVLRNQVIERVVFGAATELVEENAKIISFATYEPFNRPNKDVVGDSCSGNDLTACLNAIEAAADPTEAAQIRATYEDAVAYKDAQDILSPNLLHAVTTDNQYLFNYGGLLNFMAGLIVFLIIISFCFDIALRSVKLGFLQLIAPIPIIASIDPKSDVFNKWVKTTVGTYFDLFIRLMAVYFALFVISLVNLQVYSFSTESTFEAHPFLIFFVVIGALLFAKQIPKLISDITGLKIDGGFSLNPMGRLSQVPIAGKLITAATGAIGGAVAGGIAGAASGNARLGAIHGAGTGLSTGSKDTSWAGAKDAKDPHSFGAGFKGAYKNISGKEYSILSGARIHGMVREDMVKNQLSEPKNNIKTAKQRMAELSYNSKVLDKLYGDAGKSYATATDPVAKEKYKKQMLNLQDKMIANASAQKKYEDIIEVNKDRIKDIETFWDYDKSSKKSYAKTMYKDENNMGEDFRKAEEEFSRVVGDDFSQDIGGDGNGPGNPGSGPSSGPGNSGSGPSSGPGNSGSGPSSGPGNPGSGPSSGPGNPGSGPSNGPGTDNNNL